MQLRSDEWPQMHAAYSKVAHLFLAACNCWMCEYFEQLRTAAGPSLIITAFLSMVDGNSPVSRLLIHAAVWVNEPLNGYKNV